MSDLRNSRGHVLGITVTYANLCLYFDFLLLFETITYGNRIYFGVHSDFQVTDLRLGMIRSNCMVLQLWGEVNAFDWK